ncbi:DUF166 family (seleno)protein DfsP [Thiovibrio sp. JS02]
MPHQSPPAHPDTVSATTLVIFQEKGSGDKKVSGIEKYGQGISISKIYNIDAPLPDFIDDPEQFLPEDFRADLVLSFLRHPDLLAHLSRLCRDKKIPLIASGRKTQDAITPFTCCGLGRLGGLGAYGEQFGFPELDLDLDAEDRITSARVVRGASCGATWEALAKIIGQSLSEALVNYAREVQYLCQADPSAFDPISGKSAVHYAGHVHSAALKKAAGESKK